jgi:hypothetical protein
MKCHKCKEGTIRPHPNARPGYPLAKCDKCGYQALFASVETAGTPVKGVAATQKVE